MQKDLEDARLNLANCSYTDNPAQWMILLKNITELAIQLSDITRELIQLERKDHVTLVESILFCLFLDCHVHLNHGTLPY